MLHRIEATSARRSAASGLAAEVEEALAPVACQQAREGFFLLFALLRQYSSALFHFLFPPSFHSLLSDRFLGGNELDKPNVLDIYQDIDSSVLLRLALAVQPLSTFQ